MSADNGVYILKCNDQYRVKHLRAIDNLYYFDSVDGKYKIFPSSAIEMFGDVKSTKNSSIALRIAELILKNLDLCEYGIQVIPCKKTWSKLLNQSKQQINK